MSSKVINRLRYAHLIALIYIAGIFMCPDTVSANPDSVDYFNDQQLRYSDFVYSPSIHSILLYKSGFLLSDPIIQLNSGETLELEFDDIEGNIEEYYYSFTHCDAAWNPTEIWSNEYIDGMMEDRIEQYEFSFNTRESYTHYSLVFPNTKMSVKLSGNYIIRVFKHADDGSEQYIFTRRFMVFEPKVSLEATVKRASTIDETDTHQEIDFSIYTDAYRIDAPYQDLKVCILQNNRWDNALTTLKPFMVKGDILDYSFDNGTNQFVAGNEFRHFDLKSLKYLSDKVKEIHFENSEYHVSLWETERRIFKVYIGDEDINGRFLLKTEDESSIATMGEYAYVDFFLAYSAPLIHGNMYVGGAFNGWQYGTDNRMTYNFQRHGYEASLYLKQGYYNYNYVFLENNSVSGDISFIEGSHHETENNYTILVYHHERGTVYDQLIAVGSFNSRK
ncbi:MAG: DUF5103 domain-containing protein [Bacteroidales bacterium]|nr:DUF5103 domain-containing protein [Bacteroidales bacterium]